MREIGSYGYLHGIGGVGKSRFELIFSPSCYNANHMADAPDGIECFPIATAAWSG
jgi:hypothetical protein